MSRLLTLMPLLLVPALAWADLAPGGGGCRCSSAELGVAGIPILAVALLALARRMHKAC